MNDYKLTDPQLALYDAIRNGEVFKYLPSGAWVHANSGSTVTRQAWALIKKGLCVTADTDHGFYTVTRLAMAKRATHLTGGAI